MWRNGTKLTASPISVRTYIDTSSSLAQGSSSYTVTTNDATGTSVPSAAASVVYDTVPPPVPTGLTAVTPTNQKPALSWVSGGNDATSGFVNYQVYRGTTLVGSPTGTTFTDTTLVTSGSQTYTVKSVDAAGNVSTASVAKAVMFDTVIPSAPVLSAPAATNTSTTLTWTASTDLGGSTLTSYAVYRNGVLIGAPTPATALTYTDTGAMSPGTYTYTVYALDGAGNSSLASNAKAVVYDVTPPGTPTGLGGTTPTNQKPILLWTAATDTGGAGIVRYDVYRGATLAGSTAVTSFTDAALTQSSTNVYTIRAVDGAGNVGPASSPVTVVYDVTAPTIPGSLTATTPTNSPPVLSWAASTDALSGVDHYDVFRGSTKINSSPVTGLGFTDTSPVTGSQTYSVKAIDAAGNTTAASTAKIVVYDPTPPPAPTLTAPTATSVDPALTWTAVSDTGGSGLARLPRLPRRDADRHHHLDVVHRLRLGRRAGHLRLQRGRVRRRGQHDLVRLPHRDRRHVRTDDADLGHGADADRSPSRDLVDRLERRQRTLVERDRPLRRLPRRGPRGQLDDEHLHRYRSDREQLARLHGRGGRRSGQPERCERRRQRRLRHQPAAPADERRRHDADRDRSRGDVDVGGRRQPVRTRLLRRVPRSHARGDDDVDVVHRQHAGGLGLAVVHGEGRRPRRQPERVLEHPHDRVRPDRTGPARASRPSPRRPTTRRSRGPPRQTRAARTSRTTTCTGHRPEARRRSSDRATAPRSAIRR